MPEEKLQVKNFGSGPPLMKERRCIKLAISEAVAVTPQSNFLVTTFSTGIIHVLAKFF